MAENGSQITVISAANGPYALPLAVMLRSVGERLGGGRTLAAFVLDDGVEEADKRRVEASMAPNTRLQWRRPSTALTGLPVWGRMPPTTYHKLTLAEWVPPDVDRALWLDCDVLALEDVSALWRTDLAGSVIAAVQDHRVPYVSSRFGVGAWRERNLRAEAPYFNAGVLLADMKQWRERRLGACALEYLERYGERVFFWDQEALNACLGGRWAELDRRWNQHPSLAHRAGLRGNRLSPPRTAAPCDGLVHFSGSVKPWKIKGSGAAYELYEQIVDRTAWAGQRPPERWSDALRSWYERSWLRRWLYPTEQLAVVAQRALTRRRVA